jgi:hypothetical protein
LNQYEKLIGVIGNVFYPYDSDQLLSVFGLGGLINGQVNNCFPLTSDEKNPNVYGLQGILEA